MIAIAGVAGYFYFKALEKKSDISAKIEKWRVLWRLSDEDVISAMALMEADGVTKKVIDDDLHAFLYFKGISRNEESMVRKRKFNSLLNPDKARVSEQVRKDLKAARDRLTKIVVNGEEGKNVSEKASLFDVFVSEHPEWSPEKSWVAFRDHECLKDKPHAYVERIQHSGLCYMHAPVVLQHYLVAMSSDAPIPMLDMAIFLKKYMSGEQLERHIWLNLGGDSKVFLENILVRDPVPVLSSLSADNDLESRLRQYGAGLVSGFKVEKSFNSPSSSHIGTQLIISTGCHAMVLVGFRKEGSNIRYLIQNWWRKKAFVEVDEDYLVSCGAVVHFVKTPQDRIGEFPTNSYDHVECEFLDAEEIFAPEMSY